MKKLMRAGIATYIIAALLILAGSVAKIQHYPVGNLLLLLGVSLSPIGLAFLLFAYLKKARQGNQ